MPHSKRFLTANDNAPLRAYPLAVNTRFPAASQPEREPFGTRIEYTPPPLPQNDAVVTPPKKNILTSFALIAAVCVTCVLVFAAHQTGLGLTDKIGIVTGGSLAFAAISKSRIALVLSIAASLLWAVYSLASPAMQSLLFFAFPAIWSMQTYLSSRVKSRLAIILGNIAGYYWLVGHGLAFMTIGAISPTMALSALFMAGIVHYRGGKAAEDEGAFGHETHTYFGWAFAMIGAVFISHYWLFPDNVLWQNMKASAMGSVGWKIAIALGIAATALSMMIRWKHYRVSALGAVALTLICAAIPAVQWWEVSLRRTFDAAPSLVASPTLGLMIAAATLTAALSVAVNGVRRNRVMMIIAGLMGGGAQGLLLANPALITFENIAIFSVAMCLAVCTAALLARNSFAQQRPDGL